ncbi:MAG: FecR domain-containing protein [Planctomycetes bacterium]|nr:FecR domain-containing protein [Planctomycetota bacterium]
MSSQRALELKALADSGDIDDAQRSELERLLRDDAEARAAVADDLLVDRLLRYRAESLTGDAFLIGLQARRAAERSSTSFIRAVRAQADPHHARPAPRRFRGRWLALAASAAAALAVAVILPEWSRSVDPRSGDGAVATTPTVPTVPMTPSTPTILNVTPIAELTVATASGTTLDGVPLRPGAILAADMLLAVAEGGGATLRFADGTTTACSESTQLRIERIAPGKSLRLESGSCACAVRPQPAGHPLVIRTPHGSVTAIGTSFTVSVGASTRVSVAAGVVRLRDAIGTEQEVAAGGTAEIGAIGALAPPWDRAVVLYDFRGGTGDRVADQSTRGEPLDLRLVDVGAPAWTAAGLAIGMHGLVSETPARKVAEACCASGELTVFASLSPDPATLASDPKDYPKRIVGLTGDLSTRSFLLGQGNFADPTGVFDMRLRTSANTDRGKPSVSTAEAHAQPRRLSVAYTRDGDGRSHFYVDGERVDVRIVWDDSDPTAGRSDPAASVTTVGRIADWDRDMLLTVGAERDADAHGQRSWIGTLHVIAVFDRSLTPAELQTLHRERLR